MDRGARRATVQGFAESDTTEAPEQSTARLEALSLSCESRLHYIASVLLFYRDATGIFFFFFCLGNNSQILIFMKTLAILSCHLLKALHSNIRESLDLKIQQSSSIRFRTYYQKNLTLLQNTGNCVTLC